MGIYLGSIELGGGGGGAAIGDLALKPSAAGANLYTDSNGFVWLKSGVGESDLDAYPLLPKVLLPDEETSDGRRSFLGYSATVISSNYAPTRFVIDTFNEYTFLTRGDSLTSRYRVPVTTDTDGYVQNPYPNKDNTTGQLWGNSSYSSIYDYQWNGFGTLPKSDGTDHWCLMPNFTPTGSNGLPHRDNHTTVPNAGGELRMWKLQKVTASSASGAGSNSTYTFDTNSDIIPSGSPSYIEVPDGFTTWNDATYTNRIGWQFAVTDTQVLINVKPLNASYHAYYYYHNYSAPWQVHAFNKSTGAWEGRKYKNSYVINDNGGTGYYLLKDVNKTSRDSYNFTWINGDKTIEKYTSSHQREAEGIVPLVTYVHGYGTNIETDLQGRIMIYSSNLLTQDQLQNATGSGTNTNSDHSAGNTIMYIEQARGVKEMYARGITEETASQVTGSNAGTDVGPKQTSELLEQPLYIRAL